MIFGLALVLLIDTNIINVWFLGILLFIGIILSFISKKTKIPVISWFLKTMDRREHMETTPGHGAIYFVLGSFLSLLLFQKDIALASIMILAIGDAISSLVGIHFGRIIHPLNKKKLIEGTLAGIILAFVGAVIFVNYKQALAGAVIGMIIESIELRYKKYVINDNVTLPLISGLVMSLLRFL